MTEKKQDRLSGLDWIFVCLLLLSLLGFVGYWYKTHSMPQDDNAMAERWVNVLAMDLYSGQKNTQESILQGNDLVLLAPSDDHSLIDPNDLPQAANVQNFKPLGLLTTIVDSTETTPQDPVFAKLSLLVYNPKNGQKMMVPLYQAGVRALAIYRAPFLLHLHINSTNNQQVIGYVIMSDGTQRLLHLVPFANRYLQGPVSLASN